MLPAPGNPPRRMVSDPPTSQSASFAVQVDGVPIDLSDWLEQDESGFYRPSRLGLFRRNKLRRSPQPSAERRNEEPSGALDPWKMPLPVPPEDAPPSDDDVQFYEPVRRGGTDQGGEERYDDVRPVDEPEPDVPEPGLVDAPLDGPPVDERLPAVPLVLSVPESDEADQETDDSDMEDGPAIREDPPLIANEESGIDNNDQTIVVEDEPSSTGNPQPATDNAPSTEAKQLPITNTDPVIEDNRQPIAIDDKPQATDVEEPTFTNDGQPSTEPSTNDDITFYEPIRTSSREPDEPERYYDVGPADEPAVEARSPADELIENDADDPHVTEPPDRLIPHEPLEPVAPLAPPVLSVPEGDRATEESPTEPTVKIKRSITDEQLPVTEREPLRVDEDDFFPRVSSQDTRRLEIPETDAVPPAPSADGEDENATDMTWDDEEQTDDEPFETNDNYETSDDEVFAIDLPTALGLAGANSFDVELAAERVREAQADFDAARAGWLPSLVGGIGYTKHDGKIQATDGSIMDISRNSLFIGGGAVVRSMPLAGGAGGPARLFVDFSLGDAIFEPKIASDQMTAAEYDRVVTYRQTLVQAALSYYALTHAQASVINAEHDLDAMRELSAITREFVDAGRGSAADLARIETELSQIRSRALAAQLALDVASSELTRQLRLDPVVSLRDAELVASPLQMVSTETGLRELISHGIRNRPDLRKQAAQVEASRRRSRAERWKPWLPNLYAGTSAGVFGGGKGGQLTQLDGRSDFDFGAVWQIRNLGFGQRAAVARMGSRYRQELFRSYRLRDAIEAEVAESYHAVQAHNGAMAEAQRTLKHATKAFDHSLERVEQLVGLPLEAIDAAHAVSSARQAVLDSIINYNQAQLRLTHAIGEPIAEFDSARSTAQR